MLGSFLPMKRYEELVARGRAEPSPLLAFDDEVVTASYNREPFLIGHRLTTHPLFSLAHLFALCRRMPRESILYRTGHIPGDADLDTSYDRYKANLTLEQVLDRFEDNHAYICINNPECDEEFAPVIEGLIGEVAARIDPLDPGISWYSTYIFISTRDSVTPYHMDREMNFLLQLQGRKTVHLWDPTDDAIMTSEEKDNLLAHIGGRPRYSAGIEARAMTYELTPGLGVHHPFIAPHRVHTASELSVSLALTFRTRRSDMWTDAHRFNARMRGLGLHPRPIGANALVDRTKCGIARLGQGMHRRLEAFHRHGIDQTA
ncbi:cupin-like protein [Luteibacter rhizovicinus]|uniref:Cupin-like protein n=1 Tax=Luteibacter rhizovicinus TaxID=242606 RepID=A0A4R3Z1G9_9GAMM|nr:cupin-like domain-containing protein [Luteibacter rhizovicinus]TCV97623.1 cupin-like protein [Luteibacter rhizovicinus]